MDIVIGNLIGLALIIFLFWKYVRPVLSKAVAAQKETIAAQVAESEAAKARVADAKAAHERALAEAKAEAEELHKSALEDAENIKKDLAAQAEAEVKRITEHGRSQTELNRAALVRSLRNDLGLAAIDGATKIVRSQLSNSQAQSESIDRVITELESMSAGGPSDLVTRNADLIGLYSMRAASRDAALAVSRAFEAKASSLDSDALVTASDELTQVILLVDSNPVLRKRLTEDEDNTDGQVKLIQTLFGGKVSPVVVDVLTEAVKQRWSSTNDFTTALRRQNALIALAAAERDGVIDKTEEELFSVARLLEQNPQLASLLSDDTRDGDKRVELLKSLVGDKVGKLSWILLAQTILLLRGQPADVAIDQLAELAAARRGESVAHVVSASALSQDQVSRLASVLGTIYGRTISVQTEIDPDILGGLRIAVGDEVIEADVATRLAKAAESLPR